MSGRLTQRERALTVAARPTFARLADDLLRVKPATQGVLRRCRRSLFAPALTPGDLCDDGETTFWSLRADLGQSLTEYVTEARLETAARLLRDTPYPVAAVGELVGYGDPASFRTAFERLAQRSPQEFRRRVRTAADAWQWLTRPTTGEADEPLSLRFWQRLERGKLDVPRTRHLLAWLTASSAGETSSAAEPPALREQLAHRLAPALRAAAAAGLPAGRGLRAASPVLFPLLAEPDPEELITTPIFLPSPPAGRLRRKPQEPAGRANRLARSPPDRQEKAMETTPPPPETPRPSLRTSRELEERFRPEIEELRALIHALIDTLIDRRVITREEIEPSSSQEV